MHETVDSDGRVIYTAKAQAVCLVSSNGGAFVEEFGTDGLVQNGDLHWSGMAYAAIEADIYAELDSRGLDVNEDDLASWREDAEETANDAR